MTSAISARTASSWVGDRLARLDLGGGAFRRLGDPLGDLFDFALDLRDELLDVARAFFGCLGQRANLIGDDGKALAMLSGARGLDGGIEREQIRLIRDPRHRFDDLADRRGLLFQLGNALDRHGLALSSLTDFHDRFGDLRADPGDERLQLLGLLYRSFGAVLGSLNLRGDRGNRSERLLRGRRRLLGAGRDLIHRALEFFGRCTALGDAAGEFGGGGSDALGGLLLSGNTARAPLFSLGGDVVGRMGGLGGRCGRRG